MKKERTNIELSSGELLTPQDSQLLDYDLIMAWEQKNQYLALA